MILEATPSVEQEINPWVSAAARFDEAANRLGLDDGLQKVLMSLIDPYRKIDQDEVLACLMRQGGLERCID